MLGAAASTTRTADPDNRRPVLGRVPARPTLEPLARGLAGRFGLVRATMLGCTGMLTCRRGRVIACWEGKASLFWRPITAIREADTDGNRRRCRPNWLPLVPRRRSRPAARHATVPSLSVRPRLPQRRRSQHHGRLFGTDKVPGFDIVSGRTLDGQAIPPQHSPPLDGAEGDRRRARLGRDPLPHRRRTRSGHRQEGRALAAISTTSSPVG